MTARERALNMILDGVQVFFSTLWGLSIAALSGAIPALAGIASSEAKYGQSYWTDMIPVFFTGALMGAGGYLTHQSKMRVEQQKTPDEK